MSDIETRLKKIVSKNLGVSESRITPDSRYIDDLGADSLDQVELIMKLEDEFGVEIPDEAAEKVRTIADTIKYIEEHSKENAAS
ncbi:MAG: acyl carrier protein [Rickettsiales bacterium]|nr:acyl carrier protein [Rickettsiales bacterium]